MNAWLPLHIIVLYFLQVNVNLSALFHALNDSSKLKCVMVNGLPFLQHFSSLLTTQIILQHLSDSPIPTHIHTLMAEAAMQGTHQEPCNY